ncbi:response regulator transcription factor [Deinococcus hohokamensis]|uniref:Response regulator transcription factor n=1 Tax=Deinococcus hohokamensis TaxID=309883 RepID=A0ABV9ICT0_9DEIO
MNSPHEPVVYLVDDDDAVREALAFLLRTVGLKVESFPDGPALLMALRPQDLGCLLLDIRMPQVSGLQLQAQLQARGSDLPVIIMTGHGNVDLCRRAFQQGAIDFLEKPVDETVLLEAVQRAIQAHRRQRDHLAVHAAARQRLSRLSDREREVLAGVMNGETSKQSARVLGISARTVETHRASVFQKLEVRSLAELMRVYLNVAETSP